MGGEGVHTLHLLGSGGAWSDGSRTTTMLALEGDEGVLLIDCGGDAAQRLLACGVDARRIMGVVLTHEHADHVGGLPLLCERLWLAGRRQPLPVVGVAAATAQAQRVHNAFDTSNWEGYGGIDARTVEHAAGVTLWQGDGWRLVGAPGLHPVPVLGVRLEGAHTTIAYSADSGVCDSITELARGAQLLLHDANGGNPSVHATPEGAAAVAQAAGVQRLVLVHLGPHVKPDGPELAAARQVFPNTELGFDGARYPFGATSPANAGA